MLENLGQPESKNICTMAKKMRELDDKDLAILEDALANPEWGNTYLARRLNHLGFKVARDTLTRHRGKDCSCVRESK
jgi:hypothetical protein